MDRKKARIDESSANFKSLRISLLIWQSLVYMVNKIGDKTQPWGAPVFVVIMEDEILFNFTYWVLFDRKLPIQEIMCELIPKFLSLDSNILGLIVLKADEKSTNKILQ